MGEINQVLLIKEADVKSILLEVVDFNKKDKTFKLKKEFFYNYNPNMLGIFPKFKGKIETTLNDRIHYFEKTKEIDINKLCMDFGSEKYIQTICNNNLSILRNFQFL